MTIATTLESWYMTPCPAPPADLQLLWDAGHTGAQVPSGLTDLLLHEALWDQAYAQSDWALREEVNSASFPPLPSS